MDVSVAMTDLVHGWPAEALGGWAAFARGQADLPPHAPPAPAADVLALRASTDRLRARVPSFALVLSQFGCLILQFVWIPGGIAVDSDADRICTSYAGDEPLRSLGSARAQARNIGTTRQKIAKQWLVYGATCWLLWLGAWRTCAIRLCDSIVAQGGILLTFIFGRRCDETPQTITVIDSALALSLADETLPKEEWNAFRRQLDLSIRDTAPAKLLNTEPVMSLVCILDNRPRVFSFRPPMPYQPMEKTTASAYFNAWSFIDSAIDCKPIAARFRRGLRWLCLDGDSSPARADRAKAMDVCEGKLAIPSYLFVCCLHRLCTARQSTFHAGSGDNIVSFFKHASLALRQNNAMKVFRACLRRVIKRRPLRILRTPLPREVKERQEYALEIMLPDTVPGNRVRRAIISSVFSGEWTITDAIEVRAAPEPEGPSDEVIAARLCTEGAVVLAMSGPRHYPGRGWVRPEHAPAWLALNCLPYGLLAEAVPLWVDEMSPGHLAIWSVRRSCSASSRGRRAGGEPR